MQSKRDIKRRIRSVENVAQITKAMEVVSMNKMRRSQMFALAARPYALSALDMLKDLVSMTPAKALPSILKQRPIKSRALLVITADKGLVGGFNSQIIKKAEIWIREQASKPFSLIVVGKKAKEYFERRGIPMKHSFAGFGDFTQFNQTQPVADSILEGFEQKKWDAVDIIYPHFRSTLKQEIVEKTLLPTTQESLSELVQEIIPEHGRFSELRTTSPKQKSKYTYSYTFEPSASNILSVLIPTLLRVALHHGMLEANASEHSARMVTMKNASDNALDLKEHLTLEFNKARQAGITAEISEIVAGAEALA